MGSWAKTGQGSTGQIRVPRRVAHQDRRTTLPGPTGRYADYRDFAALDQRFHDTIAAASHRPLLADAVERLHSHLHVFRLTSSKPAEDPTLAEHERVVRAILRRKADRAAEAMSEHLTQSLQRQLSHETES